MARKVSEVSTVAQEVEELNSRVALEKGKTSPEMLHNVLYCSETASRHSLRASSKEIRFPSLLLLNVVLREPAAACGSVTEHYTDPPTAR